MTIAQASQKCGLSADTLRYYERIGLIPRVNRNANGIRDYTEKDCNWVNFIKCMRSAGIQVEALIEYVALFQQGESTHDARKEILIEQRDLLSDRITDLQETLNRLNYKIDSYDQIMHSVEKKLNEL